MHRLSRILFLAAGTLGTLAPTQLPAQTGDISAHFTASAPSLEGHPAMITVLRDGSVVAQGETTLRGEHALNRLEAGTDDIRVESDGAVTEVKRGVHVIAGQTLQLQFALHPGKGVHIVEYATGGLSREEVAARLNRLDAAVDSLRTAVAAAHH
jgi:hypothetical protein